MVSRRRFSCSAARSALGIVSAARSNMKVSAALVIAIVLWSSAGSRPCRPTRGLCLDALEGFRLVDDEARMGAGADGVELVLGGDLERHLAALDRYGAHRDLDRHAHQGGCEMLDRDLHADRVLARIGVFEDELATGMFDVQ